MAKTPGTVTMDGVQANVSVLVRYLDAWLDGRGAAGIDGLMEDAATAEISRCQLWQWIHHAARADGQTVVTRELVTALLEQELDELAVVRPELGTDRFAALGDLVRFGALRETLPRFFTEYAYRRYLVMP